MRADTSEAPFPRVEGNLLAVSEVILTKSRGSGKTDSDSKQKLSTTTKVYGGGDAREVALIGIKLIWVRGRLQSTLHMKEGPR